MASTKSLDFSGPLSTDKNKATGLSVNSVKEELGRDGLAAVFRWPSLSPVVRWVSALCSHPRDSQKGGQEFLCFPFSSLRPRRAHV